MLFNTKQVFYAHLFKYLHMYIQYFPLFSFIKKQGKLINLHTTNQKVIPKKHSKKIKKRNQKWEKTYKPFQSELLLTKPSENIQ